MGRVTILTNAVIKNDIPKIQRLLRNKNVDISYTNFDDEKGIARNSLDYATDGLNCNLNIKIVKLLLKSEQKFSIYTLSQALIYASLYENIELVKLLIENGADVNYDDNYELSPLIAAIREENKEIIKLLIANGANPHQVFTYPSGNTITPYEMALNKFIFLDEL